MPSPILWNMSHLTYKQCTSKWNKPGRKNETLIPNISSTFLHLTQIFWMIMMKQAITLMHSYRVKTTILDLRLPQPVIFILHLSDNTSLLILDQKHEMPLLTLPLALHPRPTWSVLPPFTSWILKQLFQITLRRPSIFSKQTHLKSQIKSLHQLHILHQVAILELNPIYC